MVTFNIIQPRQKAIALHFRFILLHLHHKGGAQVYEVSITDIGKQHITETLRVFFPEMIKVGLPEKINKQRKPARWIMPVIIFFEMILVKKFNMLHGSKIEKRKKQTNGISISGEFAGIKKGTLQAFLFVASAKIFFIHAVYSSVEQAQVLTE